MRTILVFLFLFSATIGASNVDKRVEMLYPTVIVDVENGHGSGVIIQSDEKSSIILTARHVIEGETHPNIIFFPDNREIQGKVVKISEDHDLALVEIRMPHPYVARRTILLPEVFDEVYKVGGGLNHTTPYPTKGMVSIVDFFTMQISSPIIFGDSGGGVFSFIDGQYHLVGIISQIGLRPTMVGGDPVPHIAIAVNSSAIEEFLTEE